MSDMTTVNCTTGDVITRPLTTAELAQQQADADALTAVQASNAAFRGQIVTLAQSAVGVTLANLTQAQIKSLMAVLLYKAGGVDAATLQVLPLTVWAS